MSTQPGHGIVIGGVGGPTTQPSIPTAGNTFDPEIYRIYGVDEEDPEESSILGSLIRGAAVGALDPLTFIDPVDRVVEGLRAENENGGLAAKIGYGLGYFGGFLIPGGLATKVGTYGVRALDGLKGLQLLRAAEAGTELTRLGVLAQGSIAGGILSAGMSDADDPKEFFMDTAVGTVLGGVGDVAIQTAFRTIVGAGLGGKVAKDVENSVKKAASDGLDIEDASLAGRANRLVDDLVSNTHPNSSDLDDTVQYRKNALLMGVDELGLNKVEEGMVRVVPAVSNADDMMKILRSMPEIRARSVQRQVIRADGTKRQVTDILVARRNDVTPEVINSFLRNGFVEGQEAIWNGRKYILTKPSKNAKYVMGIAADATAKATPILRSEMQLSDLITTDVAKRKLNPHKEWADFAREHGPFPFVAENRTLGSVRPEPAQARIAGSKFNKPPRPRVSDTPRLNAQPTTIAGENALEGVVDNITSPTLPSTEIGQPQGFEAAFKTFATSRNWSPRMQQEMKLYFARRQSDLLRAFDDGEMGRAMDRIAGVKTQNTKFTNGDLEEMAGQHGYSVQRVAVPTKKGNKARWLHAVVDLDTGESFGPFKTKNGAAEFIIARGKKLRDITPSESPLAEGAIPLPPKIGSVTHLVNQAELSNVIIPWHVQIHGWVLPNLHTVRRINDAIVKQMGERAPDFYTPFSSLLQSMSRARSEAKIYLDRLTDIRGGGLFKSSRIRGEKTEDFFDLIEGAKPGSKEWYALAREKGLNDTEVKAGEEFRNLFNDLFEVAVKAEDVNITGDDFIENYLPHIRGHGHNDWVRSFKRITGKEPNTTVKQFVNELERNGQLTVYEKDPFVVAYKYINGLMYKKHVSRSWTEMDQMLKNIVVERPPDASGRQGINEGLKQFRDTMLDTMSQMKGNQVEVFHTARSVIDSINKQFDMKLDPESIDRFVNTLIATNYGAFMGWRAALAVRNLGQLLMTTLPVVGPKYLGKGIRRAMAEGADKELVEMGVLAKGQSGVPLQDMLYYDQINRYLDGVKGATITRGAAQTGKALRYVTQKSLKMQGTTDEINRKVTYYAQKERTLDALLKWRDEGWSMETFNHRSGLSRLGETATRAFHRLQPRENPEAAAKWLASQVTADAQFLYQRGAGPRAFNSTAGKIFGMYGTWPSWYASFIMDGLTKGSALDKARFVGYTALVHAAFVNARQLTGVNMHTWTGLQFGWAGGPVFDVLKDATDVISGEQVTGEPTAERQIALSKYGFYDDGKGMWQFRDPRRFIEGTFGMFIPGMYLAKDIVQATQESNPLAAALRATGFQIDPDEGMIWGR